MKKQNNIKVMLLAAVLSMSPSLFCMDKITSEVVEINHPGLTMTQEDVQKMQETIQKMQETMQKMQEKNDKLSAQLEKKKVKTSGSVVKDFLGNSTLLLMQRQMKKKGKLEDLKSFIANVTSDSQYKEAENQVEWFYEKSDFTKSPKVLKKSVKYELESLLKDKKLGLEKVSLQKKYDHASNNLWSMPSPFDLKRWGVSLGVVLPTAFFSWLNGRVMANDYYSWQPLTNTLAYGSCSLGISTILGTWFVSGPASRLWTMVSKKVALWKNEFNTAINNVDLKVVDAQRYVVRKDSEIAKTIEKKGWLKGAKALNISPCIIL